MKRVLTLFLSISIISAGVAAFAKPFSPPPPRTGLRTYTVGTLPAAASNTNMAVIVTDANGKDDCGVGGGTDRNICISDGTNWTDEDASGAAAGDVTKAGDCNSGDCFDGTSDGGTYIRLYDGDSHYLEINPGDLSANLTINPLAIDPDLLSGDSTDDNLIDESIIDADIARDSEAQPVDAFLTDIAALTDPNADRILFWDDSAGGIVWLTVGSGLSISDVTISATGTTTIAGMTDTDINTPSGGELLIYDNTDSWDNVAMSGDATIAANGAITIAADAVEPTMINDTGYTPADNDLVVYEATGPVFKYYTIAEAIALIDDTQGAILYRNGSGWTALAPGVDGQYLQTQGAAANPQWASPGISGDIEAVGDGTSGQVFTADGAGTTLYFEGSTANAFEAILTSVDVTADVTVTIPQVTGTLVLGPAAFGTDNRFIKTNGTGNLMQITGVTIDDSNNISGVGTYGGGAITSSGAVMGSSVTDGTITLAGDGTVTGLAEGGLPNSTIVSADIKDAEIITGDIAADTLKPSNLDATADDEADEDIVTYEATGTAFQFHSMDEMLDTGIGNTSGDLAYRDATGWRLLDLDANELAISGDSLGLADHATARAALGLTIGTDVQSYDADLADLADGELTGSKVQQHAGTDITANLEEETHASEHIDGGDDAIDGDKLEITATWNNITPDTSIAEADSVDDLAAILEGIDDALGGAAGATALDDIGDPDANGSIDMTSYTHTLTSDTDGWGGMIINQGVNDATSNTTGLTIQADDANDANTRFLKIVEDADGTPATLFEFHTRTMELGTNATISGIGDVDLDSVDNYKIGGNSINDVDLGFTVAQTMVDIRESSGVKISQDAAAFLTINTADGGATTISQTSDGTDQITIGDNSDRVDIASDTWDVANGVASGFTSVTATTLTDGTASLSSGALTGLNSIDTTGAADMDYGSADVTDHTFTSDGGTVIVDGVITGARKNIISDADGYNPTANESGSTILMTGAGEVGMPDCSAGNVGVWYLVFVRDASEQVELVMNGDTVNDLFVLIDGTNLDIDDEADMATSASSSAKVVCMETNRWYITAQVGVVTDGGAAD